MAGGEAEPADPFRGLYITDDEALALAHAAPSGAAFEERLVSLAALIGLSHLETAVLALCIAPELSPHYGRLYGYLHDDVTRRWPSPRLAAQARRQAGPDEEVAVLQCFDRDRRLRSSGVLRMLDDDATLRAGRPARPRRGARGGPAARIRPEITGEGSGAGGASHPCARRDGRTPWIDCAACWRALATCPC